MSSRGDLETLKQLDTDLGAVGLEEVGAAQEPYFCTPVGAEPVARLGCDGVHFVLLPGDERVFCVEPSMGEPGTYVLPVAADVRTFLAYVCFCGDANPLSQIFWLDEERFRALLGSDRTAQWPGSDAFFARKRAALSALETAFGLTPVDPYGPVRALQTAFDPSCLTFSNEYYDVLGLEPPDPS